MRPIVFCSYVSIADRARVDFSIAAFRERARRLLFNSPVLTFYAGEFFTASLTAFPIAVITFGVKHLAA